MTTITPIAENGLNVPQYGELLRLAAPKVIKDIGENRRAVKVVEQLSASPVLTAEEEALLDLLIGLIDDFERTNWPKETLTPRERLQFLLDENGLKAADIAEIMGGRPRVSAVLSGKREISKEQARRLGERFCVPPALFIY